MLRTDPEAGEEADEGSAVLVQVSTGLPTLVVPDLVGQEPRTALESLQTAQEQASIDLSVEMLYEPVSDLGQVDRVGPYRTGRR